MVVSDFKGQPPDGESRPVASINAGHRQTVPTEAEEDAPHHSVDQPPPYEPSAPANNTTATPPQNGPTSDAQVEDPEAAEVATASRPPSSSGLSNVNGDGYQPTQNMTWEQKDAGDYWERYDGLTGYLLVYTRWLLLLRQRRALLL